MLLGTGSGPPRVRELSKWTSLNFHTEEFA